MLAAQSRMEQDGGPARDLSEYSRWKEAADPDDLALFDIYGSFLCGQIVQATGALRAESCIAVLSMMGFAGREIPDALMRLNVIHGAVMERDKQSHG